MPDDKTTIRCDKCGSERQAKPNAANGAAKLPNGWKRIAGQPWCGTCMGAAYAIRVVYLPVSKPAGISWDEFGPAIRDCWRECSNAANFAMRHFATTDPPCGAGEKLKPWKPDTKGLYAELRRQMPQFPTGSLSGLMQILAGAYKAARFEMLVLKKRSLPSFAGNRIALPIRHQDYSVAVDPDGGGNILFSFRLGSEAAEGVRASRQTVVLFGGGRHAAHASVFRQVIAGEVECLDAKVKANRDGMPEVALTVRVPRRPHTAKADRRLVVRSTPDSFLTWGVEGDEPRPPLHSDNIRTMLSARAAQQQRWSDDMKYEKRWPARTRRRMTAKRRRASTYWNDRVDTAIKQSAAMVVGVARRRGCRTIVADLTDHKFAENFPWYKLENQLKNVANKEGIELECISATAKP